MTDRSRLVLASFLMLFLELALIRWAGSNVVYLSYFSNFVLLGSFLGIGVGFLRGDQRRDLFPLAPIALAILVTFVLLAPVEINRSSSELVFFGGGASGLPIWVTLPVIFVLVAAVMTMVAQGVARLFGRFDALDAYRLDITGSLGGIVAFSALSFLRAPPVAWGVVVAGCFLALLGGRSTLAQTGALLGIVALLGIETMVPEQSWSPYYRVSTIPLRDSFRSVNVRVNGIPHQAITTVERRRTLEPIYFGPYEQSTTPPRDVLIVGAGTGTDVAIALRQGARHVDAVEIDPRLQQIGREIHPDRPYDDPRVSVHIDDGRAFLERTSRTYDLILFALPDSLTLVAGQSSLRLESYLFTKEALTAARDRLRPQGVFSMYNYYRESWLVDRLAGTLDEVYGQPPCIEVVSQVHQLALLTTSRDPAAVDCPTRWAPTGSIVEPASDDHPFLYLRHRTIPGFYLLTIALILAASVVMITTAGAAPRRMRPYTDLFFMGAAFLLLETKSVVQFALLFGTTWLVNALVFAGVLLAVLGAVLVAQRRRLPRPEILYGVLFAALGLAWAVPPGRLLALDRPLRFVAATALTFAPVFVANIIFAQRFRATASSTTAFGANLLGAMVGGIVEYTALVTGYRMLIPVVALFYAAAFVATRRVGSPGLVTPAPTA